MSRPAVFLLGYVLPSLETDGRLPQGLLELRHEEGRVAFVGNGLSVGFEIIPSPVRIIGVEFCLQSREFPFAFANRGIAIPPATRSTEGNHGEGNGVNQPAHPTLAEHSRHGV